MENFIDANPYDKWSLILGIILFFVGFFWHFISYYSAIETLKSNCDTANKPTYSNDEHITLIHESIEIYSQIVRKALLSSVVIKNSERLLYIVYSVKKIILEKDIDESCEKKLLGLAQCSQNMKSQLLESVWPDKPKQVEVIVKTLDEVSEVVADLWHKKTSNYVY